MLLEEVEYKVSAKTYVAWVHRHLAKVILHLGVDDGQSAQSVPQVVECKEALGSHLAALVFRRNKRATQLYGVWGILLDKLL